MLSTARPRERRGVAGTTHRILGKSASPRDNRRMVDWPHAPPHKLSVSGVYFVTARCYEDQHLYLDAASLDRLNERLFALADKHEVRLQAWALLSNHYHFVAATDSGERLRKMVGQLHSLEAIDCNAHDGTPGRKAWFQFRDTKLTYERSWFARLRYTHENAVHHRLVEDATAYRWCSAAWFEQTAHPGFVKAVGRCKIDRVNVRDDFEVIRPTS
jgi:putative transposase